MAETAIRNEPSLYDRDFHEWTRQQARAIAERRLADVDWANIAEEIDSVGRSEKNALRSHLIVLLTHLAKWDVQPERRSRSWQSSIGNARTHIEGIIETSLSLRQMPADILESAWQAARRQATMEMRKKLDALPDICPYTAEQALDYAFWPGPDWTEDGIADDR